MMTARYIYLPRRIVYQYLDGLIDQFFKILPLREDGEPSLGKYMESLQVEMLGCKSLVVALNYDELYLSLLSILQYLIENECNVETVKREVFKAIDICEKLKEKFRKEGHPWEYGVPTNEE